MITLATLRLDDRSGLAREEFRFEAALTEAGHVALTLEQGIEADRPWGSVASVMPSLSLADLRRFRDLMSSVIFAAEACLEQIRLERHREAIREPVNLLDKTKQERAQLG